MADKLSSNMQDNVLTLACFDDEVAPFIRNTVPLNLFTSKVYRTIVEFIYAYVDQYGKAPKEHIADELEEVLKQDDGDAEMIADVLAQAKELSETINKEYVLTQLRQFVRLQTLKVGLVQAHEKLTDGDVDGAELAINAAMKGRLEVFDPGLTLPQTITALNNPEDFREPILLGIPALDNLGLGPARKELHLLIAPPKKGKSWWLTHVTKRALMQRWRGVYVTLELADKFVGKRQLQAQFALTSRHDPEATYSKLVRGEGGQLTDITMRRLKRESIMDEGVLHRARIKLEDLRMDQRLYIKEFPTGSLTLQGLEAYLDNLERVAKFMPDFLVLDYADLMAVDARNLRTSLGENFKGLRGLAQARNLAVITASQSNRTGAGARVIDDTHVAEDFSKIATADCVMTYNQTPSERMRGLARLFVANGRVEADRFSVLLTQSYASGQFALDSIYMREEYWSMMKSEDDDDDEEE